MLRTYATSDASSASENLPGGIAVPVIPLVRIPLSSRSDAPRRSCPPRLTPGTASPPVPWHDVQCTANNRDPDSMSARLYVPAPGWSCWTATAAPGTVTALRINAAAMIVRKGRLRTERRRHQPSFFRPVLLFLRAGTRKDACHGHISLMAGVLVYLVRQPLHGADNGKRFRERCLIVNRESVVDRVGGHPGEPFHDATAGCQPERQVLTDVYLPVEVRRLDNQRLTFPVTARVAHPLGNLW